MDGGEVRGDPGANYWDPTRVGWGGWGGGGGGGGGGGVGGARSR